MEFASVYQFWSKSANSRLSYGDKAIVKMAAVRHLGFWKIAVLVTWSVLACDSSFRSVLRVDQPIRRRDIAKKEEEKISIWRPSAILNEKKIPFFGQISTLGIEIGICVYQIWSKSDNSRLKYGDKAIFIMAAVRHLEFSKIVILVMCMWFCDTKFALIGQYGAEI